MTAKRLFITLSVMLTVVPCMAQQHLPYMTEQLVDTTQAETLGLQKPQQLTTTTIFSPDEAEPHYANGAVLTAFKGSLFCMWQSSQTDEDAPETCVMYSVSTDKGQTWSPPTLLASATDSTYCTSGGWLSTPDTLVAYINTWALGTKTACGYTRYVTTTDGRNWSTPQHVTMADGSHMDGIIEQDPLVLPTGRIVGAAHFQPGLHVSPIYTDDPTGRHGWKRGDMQTHDHGKQSQELEPSQYLQHDGSLIMVFRDQQGSYRKLAARSTDDGETWTTPMPTNIPDARVKQSAGNLPDGTAFLIGNPTGNKRRYPLAVLYSEDGICFDRAFLLRAGGSDLPRQRWPGRYKTLGYSYPKALVYGGKLYVVYATNKEAIECSILTL